MKILGNNSGFAIKFAVTEKIDERCFGKFCFLINGKEVGDFEQEIILGTAYNYLCELRYNANNRNKKELSKYSTNELFSYLDKWIFGEDDSCESENMAMEYGGLQVLCGFCESMDNWKGFLIEGESHSRFIISNPQGEIREELINPGEFDLVIEQTIAHFEENDFC